MMPKWWWLVAPLIVAALGCAYVIAYFSVRPYPNDDLPLNADASQPARVGQTVFVDLAVPSRRSDAHITGVHANGVSPGLTIKFVSTTYARTGQNDLAGFPLSCAGRSSVSSVAGTPLRPSTYLRLEMTATRPGRLHLTSITVDWADGPVHGSATGGFDYTLRSTPGPAFACPK
jgi:hypothetical protein